MTTQQERKYGLYLCAAMAGIPYIACLFFFPIHTLIISGIVSFLIGVSVGIALLDEYIENK